MTTSFIRSPARNAAVRHAAIPELAIVKLVRSIDVDGRRLLAGTTGIVVGAYADGNGYEVEFHKPFHGVLTLTAADITT